MATEQQNVGIHMVRTGPRGGAPTILVHPVGMDLTYWGSQIDALHGSHDLVAYDLPGNGSTPATPADWTFDATAATLAQVVASTGAERVSVVGISIGGMIAQAFALAHPEAMRSLVLIGTAATFPEMERSFARDRATTARTDGMAAIIPPTLDRWFTPETKEQRPDMAPIFLALFAWALLHQPLTRRSTAGVLIGFVGLALMGWSSATGDDFKPIGVVLALIASASWAAGSLLAPRLALPRDPVVSLTAQLSAAGPVLIAVVTVSGIAGQTDFARVSLPAWGALAFLIVASTLIGYAVFLTLNARVSPTLANTFNYAAPVIALGLSSLLLHEPLTIFKLVASGITLAGVALMIDRKTLEPQKPGKQLK